MMLYLIGVDHSVQHDGRAGYQDPEFDRLREAFPELLSQAARKTGSKVIAEENNSEVLKKFSATKSIASAVASKMGIGHLFCDPTIQERVQLGITDIANPSDNEKKEIFWLEKLNKEVKVIPILFILGAIHVNSFSKLANNSGYTVAVIEEYYGKEYFPPLNISFDKML